MQDGDAVRIGLRFGSVKGKLPILSHSFEFQLLSTQLRTVAQFHDDEN